MFGLYGTGLSDVVKANGFHLDLTLLFDDCVLVMPAGLPGYEFALPEGTNAGDAGVGSSLVYRLPEAQVHMRLHDYYMGKNNL